MDMKDIRGLENAELATRVNDLRQSIFDLRMKLKTGRLDAPSDIQKTRRDLARALTVLRERQLGLGRQA